VEGWGDAGFSIRIEADVGQTVMVESSGDFKGWTPRATNLMDQAIWIFIDDPDGAEVDKRFYRAVLSENEL
jgi:hypothetical protein